MTMPVRRAAAVALLAAAPSLAAQPDSGAAREARAHARALLDTIPAPGLAVAVAVDGAVVWAEGFGLADVEAGVPAGEHTVFGIGSVSKPLVAAALARMWERGEVELDAPVGRWVEGLPAGREGVTLRRLAGHLGGIRHYDLRDLAPAPREMRTLDRVAGFAADPLVAEPGTRHVYSSWGYVLLSAAMERIAGAEILAVVAREVTGPLGMEATFVDRAGGPAGARAAQYVCTPAGCVRAPEADLSGMWAAGGYVSTASDLARFGAAHLRPGYLRPATLEALWTPQRTTAGEATGYGMGWRTGRDAEGRRIVHHGGRTRSLRAFLLLYPDDGLAIAVLANGPGGFAEEEVGRIAAPFRRPRGAPADAVLASEPVVP